MPRPTIIVREIPCSSCGKTFGQTAAQKATKITSCWPCRKAYIESRNPLKKPAAKRREKSHLEVVLPHRLTPHFDKKKGDWYMHVRVRKSRSGEPLVKDRIYLGVGTDATPGQVNAAYTATYARLELTGASKLPVEKIRKKQNRVYEIRRSARSLKSGRDRDLGVVRVKVTMVMYKVYLPDPKVDGKRLCFGRFSTRQEAREVRTANYKILQTQFVPCAVCGRMPVKLNKHLTHFSSDCPNKVQLPAGVRPLFQTKLWNLVFSEGQMKNAGKLTHEELCNMGFMHRPVKSKRYLARKEVEFDFSLAKNYARQPDEEVGFE